MLITIFADASYCPETRACGWGAWAKADAWGSGVTYGGPIRSCPENAAEAEMMAMANAVAVLHSKGLLKDVTAMMLQSDCLRVLQIILQALPDALIKNHDESAEILRSRMSLSLIESIAVDFLRQCCPGGVRVFVRHVKGHRKGDGRNWVNRQCDAIARKYMMERRAVILLKPCI